MTIVVETIGGGGGTGTIIPPARVQPTEFEDDFHRPRGLPDLPEVSGGSLGPWWIPQWLQSNDPQGPIRPTIDAGTCAWISTIAGNPAYTSAVPSYLVWMSQGAFFDQYAEMRLAEVPTTTDWKASIMVSNTINPGAGGYTPTINTSPGFYEVAFYPSPTPGLAAGIMNRVFLRQDLAGPPTFIGMTLLPDSPAATVRRLEARNVYDASGAFTNWDFTILYDGDVVMRIIDAAIPGGMPGMGCSQGIGTTNSNPIVRIDYFKAGWLKQ